MTFSQANQRLARALGFRDPRVIQSLIVTKAFRGGVKVIPHRDGCSNFVRPEGGAPSCVTFWYALEDATAANGCLMVVPVPHHTEPLRQRRVANERGFPYFEPVEPPVYARSSNAKEPVESQEKYNGSYEFTKLEVKAGSLVLMHGNLMHASGTKNSAKSRIAFNFGVVEGELPWLDDNYLQPYQGETEFEKLEPKT